MPVSISLIAVYPFVNSWGSNLDTVKSAIWDVYITKYLTIRKAKSNWGLLAKCMSCINTLIHALHDVDEKDHLLPFILHSLVAYWILKENM